MTASELLHESLAKMESEHPGPMREYCREIRAYLERCEKLIGFDEHVCSVCGISNHEPGAQKPYLNYREHSYCYLHWPV